MNWSRILIAGIAAGVVRTIYEFATHGLLLGSTYARYPQVFKVEGGGEIWFPILAILVAVTMAFIFAKSAGSWGTGAVGGASFGFCLGWIFFFLPFYGPLVIDSFPYYMAWYQGLIDLVASVITGAVIGAVYKAS